MQSYTIPCLHPSINPCLWLIWFKCTTPWRYSVYNTRIICFIGCGWFSGVAVGVSLQWNQRDHSYASLKVLQNCSFSHKQLLGKEIIHNFRCNADELCFGIAKWQSVQLRSFVHIEDQSSAFISRSVSQGIVIPLQIFWWVRKNFLTKQICK